MKREAHKDTPMQNGLKEHSVVSGLNCMIDLFQVLTDFSSFIHKFIIFN